MPRHSGEQRNVTFPALLDNLDKFILSCKGIAFLPSGVDEYHQNAQDKVGTAHPISKSVDMVAPQYGGDDSRTIATI